MVPSLFTHGQQRGLADVDAVDGFGIDGGDGKGHGVGADLGLKLEAFFLGEFFGVVEAREVTGFGKNDRGGDHRAEERTAAHFVETGDAQGAAAARGLFQLPSASERKSHAMSIGTGVRFGLRPAE